MKRFSVIWLAGLIVLTLVATMTLRAGLAQAAEVTFTCHPDLVVSANVRVVAHCASGYPISGGPTIVWFAYPTSDSANASRMLSVFEVANATGATVTFYFDTNDLSGAAYGCLNADCRAIWAATTP
jgi:hypothetical protein